MTATLTRLDTGGAALRTFLGPLAPLLARPEITEVSINQPGEAFIDDAGRMQRIALPELTVEHLLRLASLIAYETLQVVNEERPLLSAWLPTGQRVQVVLPPACEAGTVVMSFRRQAEREFTLDDYEAAGMFERVEVVQDDALSPEDHQLRALLEAGRLKDFLREAVRYRRNIVVSGSTSSGKTTFLNTLLREVPEDERVLTIEDVRELRPKVPNCAHLLASKGGQGVARVTIQELLEACLRLRPDRIILGELRGGEASSFLHAINSGHPGSLTSVHADSPALAFERLALMVMQGNEALTRDQIIAYLRGVVDIVVQVRKQGQSRLVSAIYFKHAAT
ncbi:P-type DNA transfer ATPase VirB11 [Hydrocarboniphaga sp.]|jgi:type IV secretion system protein VirB11|uniref:P-type DNA transfer ATPase VirB11 n=2 Tax=Hydrocarboniphaga TaxID=243627 RepID=UPI002AB9DBA9|nr:P-type DNA transfer ATPase VirB11 [Hydrocarboniphaga sp.]MDZ4078507.1 P-type DNA transfer ATPase VirB11 [Hydrocarboniphaga sp.]